jgi:spore germination cell wall hydrolase CwlJ-like protein
MILGKISKLVSIGLVAGVLAFKPMSIQGAGLTDDLIRLTQIDKRERDCIAETLYFEARGEGIKGMLAVASVLEERKDHPDYPGTYCKISKQPWQFSFRHEGKPSLKALERRTSSLNANDVQMLREAKRIAERMLLGAFRGILPRGTVFYHAKYVKPTWARKMQRVAVIGQHVFYRKT